MKQVERLKLLEIIDNISNAEKAFSLLSPEAKKEFEEYANKFLEEMATSRAEKNIKPSFRSLTADPVNAILSYISDTYPDEEKEKYPQTTGKSEIYKYKGKEFRYNFDSKIVEYGFYQTKEQLQETIKKETVGETFSEKEIKLIFGKPGWNEIDSAGLSIGSWYDQERRNDYLDEYISMLEEGISCLTQSEFWQNQPKSKPQKRKAR